MARRFRIMPTERPASEYQLRTMCNHGLCMSGLAKGEVYCANHKQSRACFVVQERRWFRWRIIPGAYSATEREAESRMVAYVDAVAIKPTEWVLRDDGILEQVA